MSKQSIKILGIITGIVLVAILLSLLYSLIFDHGNGTQGRVFPDLIDKTNDINQISIKTADNSLTFIKGDKHWILQEKYDYPVPIETLQSLLLGLADLRYLEEKTSKPERYKDIGVENITQPESKSKFIQLLGEDETVIAEILVGQQTPAKGLAANTASFIRKPHDATSWMADGLKPVSDNLFDWINRQVITIPASDIKQVELRPFTAQAESAPADKNSKTTKKAEPTKPLVLKRDTPDDRDFKIEDLPAKTKIKNQAEINAIANGLFNLEFIDLIPASALDAKAWTQTAIFQDFNGKTITLDLVDASKAKVTIPQDHVHDDEGDHDHGKTETPSMTKGYWVRIAIEDKNNPLPPLQDKINGWVFLVSQETGNKLVTRLEKLIDK